MNYREAIETLDAEHGGEAVVMTNGFDVNIQDHLNDIDDDGPEVTWLWDTYHREDVEVTGTTILELDEQGYIDGGIALARVVSFEDYDKLREVAQ